MKWVAYNRPNALDEMGDPDDADFWKLYDSFAVELPQMKLIPPLVFRSFVKLGQLIERPEKAAACWEGLVPLKVLIQNLTWRYVKAVMRDSKRVLDQRSFTAACKAMGLREESVRKYLRGYGRKRSQPKTSRGSESEVKKEAGRAADQLLNVTLSQSCGSMTVAARKLGVSLATIYRMRERKQAREGKNGHEVNGTQTTSFRPAPGR